MGEGERGERGERGEGGVLKGGSCQGAISAVDYWQAALRFLSRLLAGGSKVYQ